MHCPDNSAYHNRQFNQLLAMRLILQSSSRTQNTTRFPSYSSCSSPNHTISSKLYIPVVTLTFSVLLYHYSDLQARAIPVKYHLSLQRKFCTLDASIGCKLEMYVQMEAGQAYGDTTEVCLLYVPAYDTPHQSIAVVEMFQRD